MSTLSRKRIAAQLLKCGVSRIRIRSAAEAEEALTRNDIRDLIAQDIITKLPAAGSSKAFSRPATLQKKRGRRKGRGSRKGPQGARMPTKKRWIRQVRAQRRLLRELGAKGQIEPGNFRPIYRWIKGGMFRSRAHLLLTLRDKGMLGRAQPLQKPAGQQTQKGMEKEKMQGNIFKTDNKEKP